jgi:periplasmic protein TonB
MSSAPRASDVVTVSELARAAGVAEDRVRRLVEGGQLPALPGGFLAWHDAVAAGRRLRAAAGSTSSAGTPADGTGSVLGPAPAPHEMFAPPVLTERKTAVPAALSVAMHATALLAIFLVSVTGFASSPTTEVVTLKPEPVRLVYLTLPGPGGGGGGGGLRQKAPPPKAQRQGQSRLSSPLPVRQPPRPVVPVERPEPPKQLPGEVLPPIVAPVATAPADPQDRAGVLEESPSVADSRGPGSGGGVGTGSGTGIGEGEGTGIGEGWGGGTGGGPYRPGSGIEPPRLLREVKPQYTEEARQRGIQGQVVLEIVVRSNGAVGDVRVLRGLGYGLDRRAIEAVQQWRFSPAKRKGTPVDVMVEVDVEFKLR